MTASDGKFTLTSADGAGVAGAIQSLAQALEGIDPAALDEAGRASLATARASAAWLALHLGAPPAETPAPEKPAVAPEPAPVPAAPPPVDELRFRRLLEVAGLEGAPELLARLLEDLRKVESGLNRAIAAPDAAEVRAQSHVLIALAGAVGARALQRLAEALNAAARRGATRDLRLLGETTLEQLARLIAFVAEQEAQGSAP